MQIDTLLVRIDINPLLLPLKEKLEKIVWERSMRLVENILIMPLETELFRMVPSYGDIDFMLLIIMATKRRHLLVSLVPEYFKYPWIFHRTT